jgi:hypothetical protein
METFWCWCWYKFVGATDSAFPVSLLLSLATSLTPLLKARHVRLQTAAENGEWVDTDETGFDEEEAGQTTLQVRFVHLFSCVALR